MREVVRKRQTKINRTGWPIRIACGCRPVQGLGSSLTQYGSYRTVTLEKWPCSHRPGRLSLVQAGYQKEAGLRQWPLWKLQIKGLREEKCESDGEPKFQSRALGMGGS